MRRNLEVRQRLEAAAGAQGARVFSAQAAKVVWPPAPLMQGTQIDRHTFCRRAFGKLSGVQIVDGAA